MMNKRGQGSLEYLIIIAAVLAIAAIVVLFLTGAFGGAGAGGTVSACKQTAANCANQIATGAATVGNCQLTACTQACTKSNGDVFPVLNNGVVVPDGVGTTWNDTNPIALCTRGNSSGIVS